MASVVVYKRQSYVDIIPEDDYYTQQVAVKPVEEPFSFFDLPLPICVKVISHLSLRDTCAVALTCRTGWYISQDQLMWRNKLWLRAKVVNLALAGPTYEPPPQADMLICDPLLVNNKLLYEILDPDSGIGENHEDLDIGNLLSKMATPTPYPGLGDLIDSIVNMFTSAPPRNSPSDPFSKGEGAPTFLLFGTPETRVSKKLALSFIASKDSTFDTVGLVKGKPGGVGGGVTVKYDQHLMNLLTVRRARPRLLVESPQGTAFHPDVAEVVARVDGLICYMDATCTCGLDISNNMKNTSVCESENHIIDILELDAMMRTIPSDLAPPILVLLAHMDNPLPNPQDSDSDSDEGLRNLKVSSQTRHSPAMLYKILGKTDLPWAICEVEVKSLVGVHRGLNWLLKRTLKLRNG